MTTKALPILEINTEVPKKIGHEHGEAFRYQIQEIAEIRLERMCTLSMHKSVKDVLALAQAHIPLLEKFDANLSLELQGISESSNVSLVRLMVLNNYTDMRDIEAPYELDGDGCSIIFSPSKNGPILGQTWDIHASALPFVILLKLRDQMLFSIAGCLGMTGINNHGVALAINNLASVDAHIGVIWPAIVRKALRETSASGAKEVILQANNSSGRHYAIADEQNFFSIETSGTKKKIISDDRHKVFFHTNHCLDEEMRKTHTISKESTSLQRFEHLDNVIRHKSLETSEEVFLALSEVGLPKKDKEEHGTATCGTVVMDIRERTMLACAGTATKEFLQCNQAITHF